MGSPNNTYIHNTNTVFCQDYLHRFKELGGDIKKRNGVLRFRGGADIIPIKEDVSLYSLLIPYFFRPQNEKEGMRLTIHRMHWLIFSWPVLAFLPQ